jgi:hypothetical protein
MNEVQSLPWYSFIRFQRCSFIYIFFILFLALLAGLTSTGNPTENGKFFEDVGFYRRGSSQAGMLPNAPALVLPPGHSHTIFEEEGTVLKAGFAFRLLPVEDFDCPQVVVVVEREKERMNKVE